MSLISTQDIVKVAQLQKLGPLSNPIAKSIMKLTQLDKVNMLYDKLKETSGAEFFDKFLAERRLQYAIPSVDITRIPTSGPFIVVANHPLGAIDGILMCKIISAIRPDFKLMGNFLLEKIAPLTPFVIPVNPFETRKEAFSSSHGFRACLQLLANGGCLGIFPSGEVSNTNNEQSVIKDKAWSLSVIKLIQKAGVPVIPIYFHAKNSAFFYRASRIHPQLQTMLLPFEMLQTRTEPIHIRIGKVIKPKEIAAQESTHQLCHFLMDKVYRLEHYYYKPKKKKTIVFYNPFKKIRLETMQEAVVHQISQATPSALIQEEIAYLSNNGYSLFTTGDYEVFLGEAKSIQNLLTEIGRLREVTFRAAGEGSNNALDLDEYDQYYKHLILWDHKEATIVGAYRMGIGSEILRDKGVEGFYTSSLFEYDASMKPFLRDTIEIGRAFIVESYQQKPMPLFLLWRGIIHVCFRYPTHQYLMGGVSISQHFSPFSKCLLIDFIKTHYYDHELATKVRPKNPVQLSIKTIEKLISSCTNVSDLQALDSIINDIEPELRVPILIKKYIKQNGKIIGFNEDKLFNNVIDGLLYLKIAEIPEETVKPVLKDLNLCSVPTTKK